ncbi:S8 family peptidase [Haloglomus halophilum]|uniref:S8 family peptidase n=1 Tax=Haloglomus halophilum TaxID=2962672 RepID=UPI0020C9CA89|nr:S8 family serine peptidase [Haloglomus halophilum]
MNRETGLRLLLAVVLLATPLLPVFTVDLGPSERTTFGDSNRAVEELEQLFRGGASEPEPVDREVLVTVKLREAGALSDAGLDVRRRFVRQGAHHVEGYVPLSAVRDLSSDPAVQAVRLRASRDLGGRVAAGVDRIGATDLHERGLTGENVTVGIIDGGFRVSDPELAGHVGAYRSFGPPGDADHGTAVASVVADTAPDADLHVAAVGDATSAAEYREAVAWLRDSGADVIVDSGSYFGNAGADTDALSAVARNASEDAVFVTSAGNYARRHWAGTHEPDDRRWVTFRPGAEGNALADGEVFAGRVRASLEWSPTGANATADAYELYLFRRGVGGQRLVASSGGGGNGTAYLDATVPRGHYYLAIEAENVSRAHELELFATRDLTYRTAAGSLATPATAPGVLGVGAYDYEAEQVADFSSRGPVGNRTGVGLVAPDTVAAPGTDASAGTSFAAPYVAGTAALIAQANPNATAADIRAALTDSARDVAAPGPDAAAGAGLLDARAAATLASARLGTASPNAVTAEDVTVADGSAETPASHETPSSDEGGLGDPSVIETPAPVARS